MTLYFKDTYSYNWQDSTSHEWYEPDGVIHEDTADVIHMDTVDVVHEDSIDGQAIILPINTPVLNPVGGEYEAGTTVSITCSTSGTTIHYTTDGSTPTTSSDVYSSPIEITDGMTIKALAVKVGLTDSEVASETYTITAADVQPVIFIIT